MYRQGMHRLRGAVRLGVGVRGWMGGSMGAWARGWTHCMGGWVGRWVDGLIDGWMRASVGACEDMLEEDGVLPHKRAGTAS